LNPTMSWFVHWDSSFDLARGGIELSFRRNEDMIYLLVETEVFQDINAIINNIESLNISTRYHIIGTRGLGKSTVLNYIVYSLYNLLVLKKVIPVYVTLGTATDEVSLEFLFFRNLLVNLFDVPDDIKEFHDEDLFNDIINKLIEAKQVYRKKLEDFGEVSFDFIYAALENQLLYIRKTFEKVVFLIDGLDKQDTDVVLKFMRNNQERMNNIITKYNCIFIDAADPSWRTTLDTREFSGVRGNSINLRSWTVSEIEELIQKRLERMFIYSMPFERKALEILVEDFQGNSREILQYATTLLHYAAKVNLKKIGAGIAREIVWDEKSKSQFLQKIITDSDFRYAFDKLEEILSDRQIINILIAIYNQKGKRLSTSLNYEERSSVGITLSDQKFKRALNLLFRRGCVRPSKISNHIELEEDIYKLLTFADEDLGQNVLALPVILSSLESKIIESPIKIKEEVLLKEEIQKVFEQNPSSWLDYNEIFDILLENPRRFKMIKDHFKEDYQNKLKSTIPLLVGKLREETKIMIDEYSSSFRIRHESIEYETAEYYRSKMILDKIEECKRSIQKGNYNVLSHCCIELFNNLCKKLSKITNYSINLDNIEEIKTFLNLLNINIKEPIPLEFILMSLKNTISNKEIAQSIFYNMLYLTKTMKNKINSLESYIDKNNELIKKILQRIVTISKNNERILFNEYILPILLNNYGKTLNYLNEIKTQKGFSSHLPDFLKPLYDKKLILPAKIYECPKCKFQTIISATDIEEITCKKCKISLKHQSDGYVLSEQSYQSWNVWMEEYTKYVMSNLLCSYVESGIVLSPSEENKFVLPEEIDVIAVYNGNLIAIECIDYVSTNDKKNDVVNILYKIDNLDLFNKIILVYNDLENKRVFHNIIKKHKQKLYPIMVQNPNKFKNDLLSLLHSI